MTKRTLPVPIPPAVLPLLSALALVAFSGEATAAPTDVVINEVYYVAGPGEDWIELKNTGTSSVDVSSWWFCSRFFYSALSSLDLLDGTDRILGPGEILTLRYSLDLNDTSADLGLYTTVVFTSPAAMVDFVQWGTPVDVGRAAVAAAKGIWTQFGVGDFDFAPTASAGESVAYNGRNGGGGLLTLSSDFSNGAPTRGQENGPDPVDPVSWGKVKELYRGE